MSLVKLLAGLTLILAGLSLMIFGAPEFSPSGPKYERLGEASGDNDLSADVGGRYPIDKLIRYRISWDEAARVNLSVAKYHDDRGRPYTAIIFPSTAESKLNHEDNLRRDLWRNASESILSHAPDEAMFVSWWDNSQRIRFLAGRQSWAELPVAEAFANSEQRGFWAEAGGGLDSDNTRLKKLARWLSMDAATALAEMKQEFPENQPVYLLVCLDDLARLSEIETLTGVRFPLEARVFPGEDGLHAQIAEVRHWAAEKGTGSYLVQRLSTGSVRAWRIGSEAGARMLLARLLPFTGSMIDPPDGFELVYQSAWGGYLSIYRLKR